ncbi:hypothetical protein BGX30_006553 [Mortierella sp. GBA39]|nr:hypothetical protein BGX30_006553 [Mortierella sp. GBA39]
MLMNRRSQKANYFQRIMGLYLHATGCSKRTVEMLSRAHICAAYDSTREAVAALTQDALDQVRLFARESDWFVVFDNVNIPNNRNDQRLGNLNTFDNGATGTIVEGKDLGKQKDEPKDPYARFDLEDLVADGEKEVTAFRHYFVDVLHRHHPKFTPATVPPVEPIRRLETKKTVAHPLPAMKIDQSTVEGNLEIANLSSAILRTHCGTSRTPGSVGYNIDMLSRKRLAKDKPNFHDADGMLRQTFDAMVLRLWQNKLGTDLETIGTHLTETKSMQESIAAVVEALCEELCDVDSEIYQQAHGNAFTSAMLFIQDMLVYIELCAAIKQGDIGRIEQVLKTITVMFQSVATKNYAVQTLRLSQEILCGWSETRRIAMLSSMLTNTTGKNNSWIPSDLYQEHNNLLTKIRNAAGESNRSWDCLDRSASMNIRLFGDIQDMAETAFNFPTTANTIQQSTQQGISKQ